MKYISTRGLEDNFSSASAILEGLAPDGGLFVPDTFTPLNLALLYLRAFLKT